MLQQLAAMLGDKSSVVTGKTAAPKSGCNGNGKGKSYYDAGTDQVDPKAALPLDEDERGYGDF